MFNMTCINFTLLEFKITRINRASGQQLLFPSVSQYQNIFFHARVYLLALYHNWKSRVFSVPHISSPRLELNLLHLPQPPMMYLFQKKKYNGHNFRWITWGGSPVVSAPESSFSVPEVKQLANPTGLEPALKVGPVFTDFYLEASQ